MLSNRAQRIAIVAGYALMCAIWGTTWLAIKIGLRYAPPLAGIGLRFTIAGIALYLCAAALGRAPRLRDVPWKLALVLAATLFGLNYVLTYTAETHVGSGLTAVLFAVLPFFMFGFGHFLLNERTTRRIWLGAIIAFCGVALISLAANLQGSVWYALAAVGAAISSAFANVYAKRHARHDPLATLPPAMLIAGVLVGAIGFATEHPTLALTFSWASWEAVLYLALLGSSVAFFLNLWLLARIDAWVVGLSSLIIPILAVIVGVFAGGEHFGVREAGGAGLVVLGVWLSLTGSGRGSRAANG